MLATPIPPQISPSEWAQLCITDIRKNDNKLLSTIIDKRDTLRDVYNQSTVYYEKRQGRNKSTLATGSQVKQQQLGPVSRVGIPKRTTYNSPRDDYSGTSYPKMFSPIRDNGAMNQAAPLSTISTALNLVAS